MNTDAVITFELPVCNLNVQFFCEFVNNHESNVMTCLFIFFPWISKSNNTLHLLTSYNAKKGDGCPPPIVQIITLLLILQERQLILHLLQTLRLLRPLLHLQVLPLLWRNNCNKCFVFFVFDSEVT